jgi:hypothetical protein
MLEPADVGAIHGVVHVPTAPATSARLKLSKALDECYRGLVEHRRAVRVDAGGTLIR